jgi:hypothetical protein
VTDDELRELEDQLRGIASEAGLEWAIEQVDEWLAEGEAEEVSPAPRYFGEDIPFSRLESESMKGWTNPRRFLRLRDVDQQGRVMALIDALTRVTTELPAVERAMLANFTPSPDLRMAPVASVRFAADGDRPGYQDHVMTTDSTAEATASRSAAVRLLNQLRFLAVEG